MAESRHPHTPPSHPDGEGVRVVRKPNDGRRGTRLWMVVTVFLALVAVLVAWRVMTSAATSPADAPVESTTVDQKASPIAASVPGSARRTGPAGESHPPGSEPNDLAAYFQPGDPEPTGGQVIEALQQAGVRTGLGAFNPPGTSPPLEGLAVPDNFDLPEGYVRHHQVTDEGVPIEPILMFSPDFILYDAHGHPIAMPTNRVVPPELAPPGMPLHWVRVR